MKLLTLKIIKRQEKHSAKVLVCCQRTGEDAKTEDIIKVLESIGTVALRLKMEEKEGPFGFNKQDNEEVSENGEGGLLQVWHELSWFDGAMFTVWLGILYYGKCKIDHHFERLKSKWDR